VKQRILYPASRTSRSAQAFLSLILLIGAIIIVVGTTITFITIAFIDSSYGFQAANQAEAAAESGIEDAQLGLIRYGGKFPVGGVNPYTITTLTGTASVSVYQMAEQDLVTVISASTVFFRTRKVQAVFSVDPGSGQVSQVSWREVQ